MNAELRQINKDDDLSIIAELIYESDIYIYPFWFRGKDEIKELLPYFMKYDTIFNKNNICVYEENGVIKGLIVSFKEYPKTPREALEKSYQEAGVTFKDNFERLYNEYYIFLGNEFEGTYISNFCVKKEFRNQGVGMKMLQLLPPGVYSLAAVKDNLPAIKLYENFGFKVLYEYSGFTGVPCLEMLKGE